MEQVEKGKQQDKMIDEKKLNEAKKHSPFADNTWQEGYYIWEWGFEKGAEWKDQQFKENLEKKLESIRDCYQESKTEYKKDYYFAQMIAIAEIVNELFGEIEQDNSDREE